ncbi:MAG TPA: hypothetical protein ENI23_04410 [bacterium]|nr:hypothetical protein [bacterium]
MTIHPKRDSFTVHCDSCPEYFEVDSGDWHELKREIKFKNWLTYKDKNDKWSHKCPACQEG